MTNPEPADTLRRDMLVLILLVAVITIPSMFTRDLWNPDEPRYTEVGRAMLSRGTVEAFFVPHLNGEVYREKPPLFFALTAGIWTLGGGANSGRILAAFASLATVLLTYALARRMLPRPAALLAAVCAMTTGLFLSHGAAGLIDPVMTAFTTGTLLCGFRALHSEGRHTNRWWLGAYACTGMAILTKGHPGLIVPLIILVPYAFLNRKTSRGGWIHLPGVLLMLAFPALWLVPAGMMVDWDYVYGLVVKQAAGRAVNSHSHQGPFYEYLLESPWMFFPWFLVGILAVVSAAKAWRRERETAALIPLVWLMAPFLLFSLISGKRAGYLLPVAPAFGLLIARYAIRSVADGWPHPRWHRAALRFTFAVTALLGLMLAAGHCLLARFPHAMARMAAQFTDALNDLAAGYGTALLAVTLVSLAVIFVVAVWAAWHGAARHGLSPLWLLAGITLAWTLHTGIFLLPHVNGIKSGRLFAEEAKPFVDAAANVYCWRNDFSGVYNLYLQRDAMPLIESEARLMGFMARPEKTAFITTRRRHRPHGDLPLAPYHVLAEKRVGHRIMMLVGNWQPAQSRKR